MQITSLLSPGTSFVVSSVDDGARIRLAEVLELATRRATARYGSIELILLTAIAAGVYDRPEVAVLLSPQEVAVAAAMAPAAAQEVVEAIRTAVLFETSTATIAAIMADTETTDEEKIELIELVTI